jgi:anti-sigma B factor antagonist
MTTTEFRISTAHLADDAYIVSLGGDVDLATAPHLEGELAGLTDAGARRVVVDLAGAAFIDSTVLGVLLKALTRLDARSGELVLVSDDVRILKIFEVTGLGRVFRIEPTLTGAIDAILGQQSIAK